MVRVAHFMHAPAEQLQSVVDGVGHGQDKHRSVFQLILRYMRALYSSKLIR